MGTFSKEMECKSGLQQALEDVEAGRVYEAKSIEDLMAQLDS